MRQSSLHTAGELAPELRGALETLLGRALQDNEAVSVRTYQPHEARTGDQQKQVIQGLRRYLAKIDEKTRDISSGDEDEVIEEAMQSVRPGYRSLR